MMIASDIHGSNSYCLEMMEAFEREKAETLLLLGDLLHHGPRIKHPGTYDRKDTAALLNGIKERILCVRGNCDTEEDQKKLDFPIMDDYRLLYVNGRTIFATHGHIFNTRNLPALPSGYILLHGHTHIPAWKTLRGGNIYVNPGSVSMPRGDSKNSYMMLTDEGMFWKYLDGSIYHTERL